MGEERWDFNNPPKFSNLPTHAYSTLNIPFVIVANGFYTTQIVNRLAKVYEEIAPEGQGIDIILNLTHCQHFDMTTVYPFVCGLN